MALCLVLGAASCALLGAASCALPARLTGVNPEIPQQATPIVIDEGLRKLDEPEIKRRVARMMASPEMRAVERELVAGLVDGTLSALGAEERAARIHEITTRYAREVVRAAANEALDSALEEGRRQALSRLAGSLAAASVAQLKRSLDDAHLGTALSSAITEQLGPAVQKVLRENVAPGLAAALAAALEDDRLERALGRTARMLSREAVLGAHEAIAELQHPDAAPGDGSLLARLGSLVREGTQLVRGVAWLLGAVALALAIWVARLLVERRRHLVEREERAMRARLLAELLQASEGKPWSDELLRALAERLREAPGERP